MAPRTRLRRQWRTGQLGIRHALASVVLAGVVASGSATEADARIGEHLAAAEFEAAVRLAQQAPTVEQRDESFRAIATHLAQIGARDVGIRAAGVINNDDMRQGALADINRVGFGPNQGPGGSAAADFDSLIELITSTVDPESWEDLGGTGTIREFPGGVFVDVRGVMWSKRSGTSVKARDALRAADANPDANVQRASALRKVSLTRLERQLAARLATGERPDEAMQYMAGIRELELLIVDQETDDIVIAGPAGGWQTDAEGRVVSTDTGRPMLQLDDLIVMLRLMRAPGREPFGCAITPRAEGLSRAQNVANEYARAPLRRAQRQQWLEDLRSAVGLQDIAVFGLDPRTRVARLLVEADYHMKLVGIGLEKSIPEVPSYLDLIEVGPGQSPPPLDVLRWWFTLDHKGLLLDDSGDVFELVGQSVRLLSENELLTAQGQRVHTGASERLNREFAARFTEHFEQLAEMYPVYADLENVFSLALLAAILFEDDLPGRVGWSMECFADPAVYQVGLGLAPQSVDTVINDRSIGRRHLVAMVSGGVRADPAGRIHSGAKRTDQSGRLAQTAASAQARPDLPADVWWWD